MHNARVAVLLGYLEQYAMSFLGIPYVWGGNNPVQGVDCSGFVLELLRAGGQWGRRDATAQDIFVTKRKDRGMPVKLNSVKFGDLVFYGSSLISITHVSFALSGDTIIEAGGGGQGTKDFAEAARKGAFVRMRPLTYRHDIVAVLRPRWGGVGPEETDVA